MSTSAPRYADSDRAARRADADAATLGFEGTDTTSPEEEFSAFVDRLNELASKAVVDFCDRRFDHFQGVEESIDGNGRQSIRLPNYPVTSVSSVTVNGTTLDPSDYRVAKSASREDNNAGVLERRAAVWPEGWENVTVVYSWGYEEPPGAVVDAAETLVIDALEQILNSQNASGAVDSFSLEGFNVSFANPLRFDVSAERFPNLKRYQHVGVA